MYEPWEAEEAHQRALERERDEYIEGNPDCIVCGGRIEDYRCYVLDTDFPMYTSVHKGCMDAEIEKMKKANVHESIIEWIQEQYSDEATSHRW